MSTQPKSERKAAGFLYTARKELRDLLVPESESLVTLLGHVEAAFEYTAEPNSQDVMYHCQQALRIIEAIEQRHAGDLPENVAACLRNVRVDVVHALGRIEPEMNRSAAR